MYSKTLWTSTREAKPPRRRTLGFRSRQTWETLQDSRILDIYRRKHYASPDKVYSPEVDYVTFMPLKISGIMSWLSRIIVWVSADLVVGLERLLNPLSLRETVISWTDRSLHSIDIGLDNHWHTQFANFPDFNLRKPCFIWVHSSPPTVKKTPRILSPIYGMRSGICWGHLGKIG